MTNNSVQEFLSRFSIFITLDNCRETPTVRVDLFARTRFVLRHQTHVTPTLAATEPSASLTESMDSLASALRDHLPTVATPGPDVRR